MPNGPIGSPSPSLGLLDLLDAVIADYKRDEAGVPHEVYSYKYLICCMHYVNIYDRVYNTML